MQVHDIQERLQKMTRDSVGKRRGVRQGQKTAVTARIAPELNYFVVAGAAVQQADDFRDPQE